MLCAQRTRLRRTTESLSASAATVVLSALLSACTAMDTTGPSERVSFGPFHEVRIYRPMLSAPHLALLLSGDGGWGGPVEQVARRLTAEGTLVAGIDVRDLFARYEQAPQTCVSPAEDLAQLAHYLRQRYALPDAAPVVIGYSAGATLAYIALVRSPPGSFSGALTLSFCADLDLAKPLCGAPPPRFTARSEGTRLLPAASALPVTWFALHGLDDEVCPAGEAREFAAAIPGAHFVGVPGISHSYHHIARWWPQFAAAWRQLSAPRPAAQ